MIYNEVRQGKEILVIDFSNCNEENMIKVLSDARDLIALERKPCLLLGVFNEKNYFTQKFLDCFYSYRREEVIPFLQKQAIIGISETKKAIVKGVNFLNDRNIKAFGSREEAMNYLITDE